MCDKFGWVVDKETITARLDSLEMHRIVFTG